MLPSTVNRVPENTSPEVNDRIRRQTEANVSYYAGQGREAIEQRLSELDREWDIERAIEANAATIALAGLILGSVGGRRWFIVPAVVSGFLLQHAVQGWCPPVPVLRRLGFRTQGEIFEEKCALRKLLKK